MKLKLPERRRFVRIGVPLKVVVGSGKRKDEVAAKNISPIGLRFETGRKLKKSEKIKMALYLPSEESPIHMEGRIAWQNKISLEDRAPYDIGVEITHIADKNKNIFLRYLCDLLYKSIYEARR